MLAHDGDGGERLQRGHVATPDHDHVRGSALVVAGPLPDADTLSAVFNGLFHRQSLGCLIFSRDYDVDIMAAAQAMIPDRKQAVGIRRQIHTHNGRLLVDHMVDEARVLMRKTVMHLLPDMRSKQVIKRRYFSPPWQFRRDLQPLGMLIEHRIDDMNECLVTVEYPMPPGEQVALKPAFALMLAQHFHDPPIQGEEFIVAFRLCVPLSVSYLKNGVQAVRKRFIWTEDSEIALFPIEFNNVTQEYAELVCISCSYRPG